MPELIADSKIAARFWSRVDAEDLTGCWLWTGERDRKGYGQLWLDNRKQKAHRVAYQLFVGPIPEGMQIDHECRNPGCVNPAHLRLATNKQNAENRIAQGQTGSRGVILLPSGRFRVSAKHHGRRIGAGTFDTLAEAEAAAIALRTRLFTHNAVDRLSA